MLIGKLENLGIHVRDRTGEQRTTCPQCSPNRKKKKDRCLAVRIDNDGARYYCHHCGWNGGVFADERPQSGGDRFRGQKEDQPGDFGQTRRRLRNGLLPAANSAKE